MGTQTADAQLNDEQCEIETTAATDGEPDRFASRARHQRFGFAVLGGLLCLAGIVFTRVDAQAGAGRWFWLAAGTVASIICLMQAQHRHGGSGADRDASPYYGIFGGVMSGAMLLVFLAVDGWIMLGILFVMATVLAFMAWIEQSTIGMTSALCVAVLCAGYGVSGLSDATTVSVGSVSVGLMLIVGALAVASADPVIETSVNDY